MAVQLTFSGIGILKRPSRYKGGTTAAQERWYSKYGREWYYKNQDRALATRKRWRDNLRLEVLNAYGNKCACCGETEPEFLALDHKNGLSEEEKYKGYNKAGYHRAGSGLYLRVKKERFPPIYQLLCHNCNNAKGYYGSCPHNRKEKLNGD